MRDRLRGRDPAWLVSLLAILLALAGVGCYRLPPPESPAAGETGGEPALSVSEVSERARVETERLRSLGPVYTPYDRGPRLVWYEAAHRAVIEALAPVVEAQRLPVRTRTLLWLLVGADGRVVDARVQTSSASERFDRAALALAEQLLFEPAIADGRRAPVWVIREISLLMQ